MIKPNDKPYRPNVGVMVLNAEGKVWIGRRNKAISKEESKDTMWQMPQGGIDENEDAERAARRELFEETGISSVELITQSDDWIYYDFPAHLTKRIAEKYRGQKQMWFVYRFTGEDSEINLTPDGHKPEFDMWRWEDMSALPGLIVPFKRKVYDEVVRQFLYLTGTDT